MKVELVAIGLRLNFSVSIGIWTFYYEETTMLPTKLKATRPAGRKSSRAEIAVLKLIQASPSISRLQLAERTGMSTAAMTGIIGSLIAKGFVVEEPGVTSGVGRKPVALKLRPSLGHIVGIDLGTYNLRVVVTDFSGAILASNQIRTEIWKGKEEVLQHCFRTVRATLSVAGIPESSVLGIGIAFSGVIDSENGIVLSYPRPGQVEAWRNVPLKKWVEDEFAVRCVLEDSVRAVATVERDSEQGRNFDNFIYVDVGMGVGSTIFIDGRIYRGSNGSGGEFGHMKVEESGPLCHCGSSGCLEAVASCAKIIDSVRSAIQKGVSSRVADAIGQSLDSITIEMIATAARENDSLAYRALYEASMYIAAASADVINLLNPEAMIFGGALFRAAGDTILEHMRGEIRRRAMEKSMNDVVFLVSTQDGMAGAKGMAKLVSASLVERLYSKDT
jgi:predicted NBD/HSP70 family sugar kinase